MCLSLPNSVVLLGSKKGQYLSTSKEYELQIKEIPTFSVFSKSIIDEGVLEFLLITMHILIFSETIMGSSSPMKC